MKIPGLNKKRVVLLLLVSFILNLAWELLQMPLYAGFGPLPTHFWMCLGASIWDAVIVVALYAAYLASGRRMSVILLLGFVAAVFIEERALVSGKWFYDQSMPLIPFFQVGLTPILQMLILPIISIKITEKIIPN